MAAKPAINYTELDEKARILDLFQGTASNGQPFFAYVSVFPSKFEEYCRKVANREPVKLPAYGEILQAGWGEVPSEEIRKRMAEKYGADEQFLQKVAEFNKKHNGGNHG